MKTLCLYYSRTNLTKAIAERIAELTDAEILEYTDGIDRSGALGYVRSCIDSFRTFPKVHIAGEEPDWESYDNIIVAMPVWVEGPCFIGKAFLKQFSRKFHGDLYLVVTHMADSGYDNAILRTYKCCAKAPKAYLSVQTKNHDPEKEIQAFVRSIEQQ